MKLLKRIASILLALVLVLGAAQAAAPVTVNAASATSKGVKDYPNKVRIYPGGWDNDAIAITLTSSDFYLKSVKSSNKNLKAKITQKSSSYSVGYDGTVNEDTATGVVGLYTKKEGQYTVTVTIGKKSNSKYKQTVSVKVYAYNDSPFKSVTVSKKNILEGYDNYYFSQKTLTFKASMASGYKLKKIQVGSYKKIARENDNYSSELTWKTLKNGGSFKLSNVKDSSKYASSYSYESDYYSTRSIYRYIRSSLAAETIVKVTYTDKYTKQAADQWFYFYYIKL